MNSLLLLTASLAATAAAEPAAPADVLVVRGNYQPIQAAAGTKTGMPLVDTPQSIFVLTEEQIKDQAFTSVDDVLRFVPGASIGQGEGHRDQLTIRGQNTTADFFIDGLRDDVQYFRPLYNLERVEVLKGPNALLFGRGGGGGVINRVTKAPALDESFTEVDLSGDTFGSALAAIDSNAAVTDNVGFRLNAFAEHLENHRDVFDGDRFAINPTLLFDVSPATDLLLSYEYVQDDRVVDRGVPSLDGEPLRGFSDTFFGSAEGNFTDLRAHIVRGKVDHRFSNNLRGDVTLQYANYDKLYQNVYPTGIDLEAGTVGLDGYRDSTKRENFILQSNLVAEFATGGIEHTVLFGGELIAQDTDNARRDILFADSDDDQIETPFTDPLSVPTFSFPEFTRSRASEVRVASAFVQDEIDLGAGFKLIGGLRYDRFEIEVEDRIAAAGGGDGALERTDDMVSPRAGLIYKPLPQASLYASYAKSFLPRSGDQFLTLSPTTEALDPEEFENIEVGFKWDVSERLALTGAIFRIERESGTTVDPNDPERTILFSAITRGAEIQLTGSLTPFWAINGGYSYLDAEEDGRVVDGLGANRPLAQVPEHMLSLWNRFDVTERFSLGIGASYQAAQFASLSGNVELPSYTRVDAAATYDVTDRLRLQLNVENLLDEEYFPAAHNDNNITTGEPLNARLTLRTRF
ncbi:TonB-dependent receptor [Parvularcula maris]|uniref:TonB-dependent siderophore receptor n=1 Tax=Parvularcula maris TaxID=2965077 RepID=A0A9X2L923_9PROT|nr:TonB-dependent siderophore receptor [Parvularcula maris]MCQ8185173.1 TonB-dependent siderophore receptor [Parvularcula maris]